jgi:hypothetical protein
MRYRNEFGGVDDSPTITGVSIPFGFAQYQDVLRLTQGAENLRPIDPIAIAVCGNARLMVAPVARALP